MIKLHQNINNAKVTIVKNVEPLVPEGAGLFSMPPVPGDNALSDRGVEPMPESGLVSPQQTVLDADLTNDIAQLSAVWMTVIGLTPEEIEEQLGQPPGYVATLRSKPSFRIILKRCLELKAQSLCESGRDPVELYNSQILASAGAIIQIRDNPFATDTARLKAAEHFTDRAPKAPKVRREVEQHQTIITLPVSALRDMQQALLEEGSPQDLETIELLEGAGYTVSESDNGGNGNGKEDQIEVERVE